MEKDARGGQGGDEDVGKGKVNSVAVGDAVLYVLCLEERQSRGRGDVVGGE